MTWEVPVALEDAVYAAASSIVGDEPLATGALTKAIIDRSKRYTSDREKLAAPKDARADLAARAAFFTIADAIKIAIPLRELANRDALPNRAPLRVVDVGAGCGAMSLGLLATFERDVELVLLDHDRDALKIAEQAIGRFRPARVTTREANVISAELPSADLVVIGTVLNELDGPQRVSLVQRALRAISDDGAVIIVEPALRETSRALHELRDAMIRGGAHVFAPCTRASAPCPMLANESDWCHEDRAVTLPPRTAELARLTHLRDSGLKFSYLVLRREARGVADQGAWRIVSEPFVEKGKREVFGCSERGRVPLRLLKRNRSEGNRAFEDARRGDVIATDATGDERVEIGKDARLERIEPARR